MTALDWETDWWGTCQNTYGEETKQLTYARLMGLKAETINSKWPTYNLSGLSIIDIGGGPCSLLLKATALPLDKRTVWDPATWPQWVHDRYREAGITYETERAESLRLPDADEVWLYNVLQHVDDPEKVVANAFRTCRRTLRFFDWIDTPPHPGHPHTITLRDLARWWGPRYHKLTQVTLNENECVGTAAYSVTHLAAA